MEIFKVIKAKVGIIVSRMLFLDHFEGLFKSPEPENPEKGVQNSCPNTNFQSALELGFFDPFESL